MIGRTLSHYRLIEQIGAGGMGVVYKAEDTRLGRMVAIKLLSETLLRDRVAMERFQREARAASALNHPNICTIHEVDDADGTPFLVMEMLEGESFRDILDRGPLPADKLTDVAIELADALAAAHEARIIHRDLKPANLFLTRHGHAKILDFGLAKVMSDVADLSGDATQARDLTTAATTVGTIAYMSPEQARAEPLDARTDLFSLGAVLYELATGKRAFAATNSALTFDRILHHDPPPPAGPLAPVIMKALEKDRELRYQSAAEIRADLKRLKHDSQSTVVTAVRRRREWIAAVAAAVILIAVIAGALLWRKRAAPVREGGLTTVAVLPFENLTGSRERDYLRLALPDELITILSYNRALAVRPFALSRKFAGDADPQQSGRTLRVADVISGHFRDAGGRIDITLEAVDVEKNNVLWRDSVNVAAEDLIALREQLATRVRSGLLPLLTPAAAQRGPERPRNDEAYTLYLQSSAMSNDPGPNRQALAKLERSVSLDPSYAPAWSALATRCYFDGSYGHGGTAAIERSEEAATRALAIDPDLIEAKRRLVLLRTEKGDLQGAYPQAKELMQRRPELADGYFAVSYVDRYGGMLKESAELCRRARAIDPHNSGTRSCALTFIGLGDYATARDFLQLDAGSTWARSVELSILIREGETERARRLAGTDWSGAMQFWWAAIDAYLANKPEAEQARIAGKLTQDVLSGVPDGETTLYTAGAFAFCKRDREAIALLRAAVERGYCSYPAIDNEPAFAHLRGNAEYEAVHRAAVDCNARFVKFRETQR